ERKKKAKVEEEDYISHLPGILQPYISKVLDVESNGHCGFEVVYFCLGHVHYFHLAVKNKLYQDTKERGKWCKDKYYISNLPSVLKRIKVDSSGTC
ncbi:hypothetical protein VP01_9855g1, partial [Puccinia sorghi]